MPDRGQAIPPEALEAATTAISRSSATRPRKEGTWQRFERYARAAIEAALPHLAAVPEVWVCAKCGYGLAEHGMEGHPAYVCVYEPRLVEAGSIARLRELTEEVKRLKVTQSGCVRSTNSAQTLELSETDLKCAVGALNFSIGQRPARFRDELIDVRVKLRAELARRAERGSE